MPRFVPVASDFNGRVESAFGIPPGVTEEYRWYQGNLPAARSCLNYLIDDEAYLNKAPDELRDVIHSNYLKGEHKPIEDFMKHFINEYSNHFEKFNLVDFPIKYNPAASPGAYLRKAGFKNRQEFLDHPQSKDWLDNYVLYASKYNYIDPYTAAIKSEMTKTSDITSGKCRIFYVAGVYTDIVGKMLCNNFNEAFKELPFCYVGWVAQYGGVENLRHELESYMMAHEEAVYTEADCTKFDLGRSQDLFSMTYKLRALFCKPSNRRFLPLLNHLYWGAVKKFLVWFDGSIKVCTRGNPSGWPNTTVDNSIDNLFFWYLIVVWYGHHTPEYFVNMKMCIVSDDSLNCIPKILSDQEYIAKVYSMYGRIFKGCPRSPDRSLNNRLFCGVRFLPDGLYDIAWQKCLWSMNFRNDLTEEEFTNKLQALATNLAGNPPLLKQFVNIVRNHGYDVNELRARYVMTGKMDIDYV